MWFSLVHVIMTSNCSFLYLEERILNTNIYGTIDAFRHKYIHPGNKYMILIVNFSNKQTHIVVEFDNCVWLYDKWLRLNNIYSGNLADHIDVNSNKYHDQSQIGSTNRCSQWNKRLISVIMYGVINEMSLIHVSNPSPLLCNLQQKVENGVQNQTYYSITKPKLLVLYPT